MATSLLGGLIVGATQVVGNFQENASNALSRGQEEDIRTIFRNKVDCKETLDREKTACDAPNGFAISGYDANGNKLIDNPGEGIVLGKSRVRLVCWKDADTGSYLMNARLWGINEAVSADTGKSLFNIPLACKGGCAPAAWGDPHTLSISVGPSMPRRFIAEVNKYAEECEQPKIPTSVDRLRRSYRAAITTGSLFYRNEWFDTDVADWDLPTLTQICNTIGYDNYVSSTCQDGERGSSYPNGKCNHDNPNPSVAFNYWNGTDYNQFVSGDNMAVSRAYFKWNVTWITGITCSGKR